MVDSDFAGGMISMVVATIFFGSMFVPIKPFDTRDGFFVMWIQSVGIFLLGTIVNAICSYPQFYTWAAVAGMIWATGNICCVPIINMIGSALGYLIWGSIQIIFGWATARFGWFGLDAEVPKSDLLEYAGVALTIISAVLFAFVKNSDRHEDDLLDDMTTISYQNSNSMINAESLAVDTLPRGDSIPKQLPTVFRKAEAGNPPSNLNVKIFAICLAIFSGIVYGGYMTPITYLQTKVEGAPKEGLHYAFSFSTGSLFMATIYFSIYTALMKNRPYINVKTALPALIYGLIWAVAQFSWFYGNSKVSQSISYPIVTRAPAILAAIWGVFYFKEVHGSRNLLILGVACVVAFVGVVCVGLANEVDI